MAIEPGMVLYPHGGPPLRVAGVVGKYSDGDGTDEVGFGTDLRWFIDGSWTGLKVFNHPRDLADALWNGGNPGRWNLAVLHALGWLAPDPAALAKAIEMADLKSHEPAAPAAPPTR